MLKRLLLNDRFYEVVVAVVSLVMGLTVLKSTPTMYYADSYAYTLKAYGLEETEVYGIPFIGFPFILYLRIFIALLEPFCTDLLCPVRIASLLAYVLSAYIFFKVLTSLYQDISLIAYALSRILSVFLTLTIYASNPVRVLFSVVPYRDVFSNLLTLLSLYLSIKTLTSRKLRFLIAYLGSLGLLIITRPELALLYSIPTILLIFTISSYICRFSLPTNHKEKVKVLIFSVLLSVIVFLGTLWLYEAAYYSYPRLGIFGRYTLFERIQYLASHSIFDDVISNLLEKLSILQLPLVENSKPFVLGAIASLCIFSILKLFEKNNVKYMLFYLLCLSLPFMMLHFILIYYGSLYQTLTIPDRYFLHVQLFIELLLSYFIIEASIITVKVLRTKNMLRKLLWLIVMFVIIFNTMYSGYNNYEDGLNRAICVSKWMGSYDRVSRYITEIVLRNRGNIMVPLYDVFVLNVLNDLTKIYGKEGFYLYPLITMRLIPYRVVYDFTGVINRVDVSREEYCLLTYSLFAEIAKAYNISYVVIDKMDRIATFLRKDLDYVKHCLYPVRLYGNVNLYKIKRECVEKPVVVLDGLIECFEKHP